MSFFKKLFNKESANVRHLKHPQDLMVKDIIVISDSFALPEQLRQQQFQVSAINSYEFEHKVITEWVLTGNSDVELFLSLDVDDKTLLKISLKLSEDEVASLFNLDEFAEIFEPPGTALLTRNGNTDVDQKWSCEQYRQTVFAKVGYFHRQDYRLTSPSEFEGKDAGEPLELFSLTGNDDQYSVDVEVWQDGDTDVFLNYYRPLSDISDLFPGS